MRVNDQRSSQASCIASSASPSTAVTNVIVLSSILNCSVIGHAHATRAPAP
nr:MAG TPA: hypothetical protein [Caudoviricetes sp.]